MITLIGYRTDINRYDFEVEEKL